MPLNKKDIKQFKDTMLDVMEPFMGAIQGEFNKASKKFEKVSKEFNKASKERKEIREDISEIRIKLGRLERRVIA